MAFLWVRESLYIFGKNVKVVCNSPASGKASGIKDLCQVVCVCVEWMILCRNPLTGAAKNQQQHSNKDVTILNDLMHCDTKLEWCMLYKHAIDTVYMSILFNMKNNSAALFERQRSVHPKRFQHINRFIWQVTCILHVTVTVTVQYMHLQTLRQLLNPTSLLLH